MDEKKESATAIIEKRDSCEISINAKGHWSGKVKVYDFTVEEARDKALKEANELAKLITEKNGV